VVAAAGPTVESSLPLHRAMSLVETLVVGTAHAPLAAQVALPILQALIFRLLEMVALLAHINLYVLVEEKAELRCSVAVVPQLVLPHQIQLLEESTGEAVLEVALLAVLEVVAYQPVLVTQEPLEQEVWSSSLSFLHNRKVHSAN
jgi:hypothetical protein